MIGVEGTWRRHGRRGVAGRLAHRWALPAAATGLAVGLGLLGWIAAHLTTIYLVEHQHLDAHGQAYRHAHDATGQLAAAGAGLVGAALLALTLLTQRGAVRTCVARRYPTAAATALPMAAFLVVDGADWTVSGSGPPPVRPLSLSLVAQALFGAIAVSLGRACLVLVAHLVAPAADCMAAPLDDSRRRRRPTGAPAARSRCAQAPGVSRAPPVRLAN